MALVDGSNGSLTVVPMSLFDKCLVVVCILDIVSGVACMIGLLYMRYIMYKIDVYTYREEMRKNGYYIDVD